MNRSNKRPAFKRIHEANGVVEDAKNYIMALADRGQLLLARPLRDRMRMALEQIGFDSVRIDHEKVHDIYLLRARIGPGLHCRSVGAARKLLFRMARQVGKRITPGLLMPSIERDRVRCAILFLDAQGEGSAVELEPVYGDR